MCGAQIDTLRIYQKPVHVEEDCFETEACGFVHAVLSRKSLSPRYERGVYKKPIATLKSHHVMMMRMSTGVGYTPAKAMTIKSTESRSCDQMFEISERSQNIFSPIFCLTKKNVATSWNSDTANATRLAMAMRIEIPKICSYPAFAQRPAGSHGSSIEIVEYSKKSAVAKNP